MLYGNKMMQADASELAQVSGVVASLPVGYTLGEERMFNGDIYRLLYNACNQQISPGHLVARNTGSAAAAGPYSCTITTTTESLQYVAALVKHATATTGTYFWGLTESLKNAVSLNAVTAVQGTGVAILPAANGQVTNGTTTACIGYCVGTSVTGTTGGSFYVSLEKKSYRV